MCGMVSSVRRESIPITDNEASFLEALRDYGSPEHKVLADLVFIEPGSSKAALLHAVFQIGMNEIRDRVREDGYQALMDSYTEEELAEQRAHVMSRRALRLAERGAE
jgi:hypothetical protein